MSASREPEDTEQTDEEESMATADAGETPLTDQDEDARATEQLLAHGVRLGAGGMAPRVFWPALLIILAATVLTIVFPQGADSVLSGVQGFIVEYFSWWYILLIGLFVVVALVVGLSRMGTVVLGRPGDEPEYSLRSWFAMLFAAGMGIGLVFYGVAEPLTFATVDPKPGTPDDVPTMIRTAMSQTFVHWGVHPWAVYTMLGLGLGLAIHRRNRPVSIRWALEPVFGDRIKGWIGDVIDILAIIGTLFGVATSLGLGVQQISAGLEFVGIVEDPGDMFMVVLIIVVSIIATISVVSGVGKGIRILSNVNLGMAGVLLLAIIVLGPTLFIVRLAVEGMGAYINDWFALTFDTSLFATGDGVDWQGTWSIFYWGWWMSWAPFVGVFIARISRGRTVREFVIGALMVPMAVSVVWFSALGGTAIYEHFFADHDMAPGGEVVAENALFETLNTLPGSFFFSILAIVLVAIFFITSSDSGSLVVTMLSAGGHPNPPTWARVTWAGLEGAVAIALLLAGGLGALQAGAIATALPFSVVLLLTAVALVKSLRFHLQEAAEMHHANQQEELRQEIAEALAEDFDTTFGPRIDDRIDYRLSASDPTWRRRIAARRRQQQR